MFDVTLGKFQVGGMSAHGTDLLALGIAAVGYAQYKTAERQYMELANTTSSANALASNALIPGLDRAQQRMYLLWGLSAGIVLLPRLMK